MAEIQRIIDWLGCLTTKQHRCGECPFNPHPGMHWPYGCGKGQNDIVEAAREALRKAEEAIPVEWLRKWPKDLREGAYIRDILRDWHQEQEAR